MHLLQIDHLTKKFGNITAVEDLNLSIEAGMVMGILGPNGSGKTTTLGMVLGITHPTSGHYQWFAGKYDPNPRRHLGALLETPNFYPNKSAVDNLRIVAHIKKVKAPPIDDLLAMVNLLERKNSRFRTYSLGMKQRLAIASAMIGDPEVLIFDEPTNGLDPQGIAEVRETLLQIAQTGKTIIMASHILDEVEKTCSHVAIIKRGKLLATGTVGSIISRDVLVEIASSDLEQLARDMAAYPGLHQIKSTGDNSLMLHFTAEVAPAEINRFAFAKGHTLHYLRKRQKSLEAEFLEITNEKNN